MWLEIKGIGLNLGIVELFPASSKSNSTRGQRVADSVHHLKKSQYLNHQP